MCEFNGVYTSKLHLSLSDSSLTLNSLHLGDVLSLETRVFFTLKFLEIMIKIELPFDKSVFMEESSLHF